MERRVVVTALGLVTPLGNNVAESWANIVGGVSGVDYITVFDTSDFNVKVAAEVKHFNPADYMPAPEVRRLDPYQHYIVAAAKPAIEDSDFHIAPEDADTASIIIGSSTGGLESYQEYIEIIRESGNNYRKMTPFAIPMLVVNGGSNILAIETGAGGPSFTMASACATGADCIGMAYQFIKMGRIDRALTGCGDFPLLKLGLAAFDRINATSRQNETPPTAVRPFDRTRQGLVFGAGAGVLALEELESAKRRGATIIAELVGYGSTTDAYHRTAPHPEGVGAVKAMRHALSDAKIAPEMIDYINAHGTATALNDPIETRAVKTVFGDHAMRLALSSTKSMTGHAMGATAAMEAVFAVLSLRDQVAPPTINLHEPDPECDLDYVPNVAREMKMDYVMSNSFGFGGHNASLIFKAWHG